MNDLDAAKDRALGHARTALLSRLGDNAITVEDYQTAWREAQQRIHAATDVADITQRAVFAEVREMELGEQERIFGFGGGGHQGGKTQEVHGPNGRIVGNVSLSEHAVDDRHGTGTKGSVPTHDRGHGAHVSWETGVTYHDDGQHTHSAAEAKALMRDFFGRDLADHEVAALVGAQPGFHVYVDYSQHSRYAGGPGAEHSDFEHTPALAFEVRGDVAGYPDVYTAHRLLFREADGTLTMGNADSNLRMARGYGLGLHIFKDQVAALSHFNVARLETSANGNHHTLARGGTSGFYTWARFGFNGPIKWNYIQQDLRANHLPPVGREYRNARTTADLMKMPGGAAEWKRIGASFHGVFDLTPGSDSMRVLEGYLAEKGIAWDSTVNPATIPADNAFEQRAAQSGDAAGDMPPDLTPEDEAILDRVWASLGDDATRMQQPDHEHQFVAERCLVCGCGEPENSHHENLPTMPRDPALRLTITACPDCGRTVSEPDGAWYVGMTCPDCGHRFTAQDETAPALAELRAFRAEVLRRLEY